MTIVRAHPTHQVGVVGVVGVGGLGHMAARAVRLDLLVTTQNVPIDRVNEAFEKVAANRVRYRAVLDLHG